MKLKRRTRQKTEPMELEPDSSYLLLFKNYRNAHLYTSRGGVRTQPKKATARKTKAPTPKEKKSPTPRVEKSPPRGKKAATPKAKRATSVRTKMPKSPQQPKEMTSAFPQTPSHLSMPVLPPSTAVSSTAVAHSSSHPSLTTFNPTSPKPPYWYWMSAMHPPLKQIIEKEYQTWLHGSYREPSASVRIVAPTGESASINFTTMLQDNQIPLIRKMTTVVPNGDGITSSSNLPTQQEIIWYWTYLINPTFAPALETEYQKWLLAPNRDPLASVNCTFGNQTVSVNFNTMMQDNQIPLMRTMFLNGAQSSVPPLPSQQAATSTLNATQQPVWSGKLPEAYAKLFEIEYQTWLQNPFRSAAPSARIALLNGDVISLDFNKMLQDGQFSIARTLPINDVASRAAHSQPTADFKNQQPRFDAPECSWISLSNVPHTTTTTVFKATVPTPPLTVQSTNRSNPQPQHTSNLSREESLTHRWEYIDDNDLWSHYPSAMSSVIESLYEGWKKKVSGAQYYSIGSGSSKHINFDQMEELDMKFLVTRKIRRVLNF